VPGLGTDNDRHQTAVQTFRSLPLDRPMQLALFDGPSLTPPTPGAISPVGGDRVAALISRVGRPDT
jgi:hypothetical protein